ncbi:MAG: hypothetical protein Q8927_19375 [Bacteroidota bacterium]|nr:hypothetical protein [Bacteroidota bacterium]MDP4255361.1 hypothetical protein [Bacteroidota bacterium]MDP4260050.1 hypothetical protein [Bacteroidota bacterium]
MQLINRLNAIQPLSTEVRDKMISFVRTINLDTGEDWQQNGYESGVALITKGILKRIQNGPAGSTRIVRFFRERRLFITFGCSDPDSPDLRPMIAIEPTHLEFIAEEDLKWLYRCDPAYNRIGLIITLRGIADSDMAYNLWRMSPKYRLPEILKHHSWMLGRVPREVLAEYLQISMEELNSVVPAPA